MEAAQARGHEIWITEMQWLSVIEGQAHALLQPVQLTPVTLQAGRWQASPQWYDLGEPQLLPLTEMQAVFMRKDPPADEAYFYGTYILDYVDPRQTLVLNTPHGLRAANEKMYALQFQDLMPTTQVTARQRDILNFVEQQGKAVMKPLDGKGGEGILFLAAGDRNLKSMIELSTQRETRPVMVQAYLPAASEGDKRIIVLNGEPIGAVNRVPAADEFRGNMAVGGRADVTELSDRDRQICDRVGPVLRRDGLYFVGLDVIGGYLTEVNVTSPTGIREIDRLNGVCLGETVMAWLEEYRSQ